VSARFYEKLLFLLLRLTRSAILLLPANRKASWNKARIRCKRCACRWTIWSLCTQTGKWPPLKQHHSKR